MKRIRSGRELLVLVCAATVLCAMAAPSQAFRLPDSEQTKCYQAVSPYAEIPCAGTGQDGAYTINPLSYTDNGNGTVTDKNTGLMWQQQDDAVLYNWYRATGTYDAVHNPETTDVCGTLTTGGHSDWRLPTVKELTSLVDYAIPYPGPTIRTAYFPNTKASDYWSSTTYAGYSGHAWIMVFDDGDVYYDYKDGGRHVRCVRGGQTGSFGNLAISPIDAPDSLEDNGNGTVTDTWTGLVWQQGESPEMMWGAALSYCENLTLGGSLRWRLPNIKELESLADFTRYGPAIDTAKFPNAHASNYWSSTTDAYYSYHAWLVDFRNGYVYSRHKGYALYVRCVRGGQSGSFGNLGISPVDHGFGPIQPGSESSPQTFTVTNTGTAPRTITAITKTGATPSSFRIQNDLCTGSALWPSGTCSFEAVFTPTGFGWKEATLIVKSGLRAAAVATLTGRGFDTTPPTGTILISGGAATTTTTAVTLTLSATDTGGSGLGKMRFRNGGTATWSIWEFYAATKAWTLTDGAGGKLVFVQFKDNAGNISDSDLVAAGKQGYRDTIRLIQ